MQSKLRINKLTKSLSIILLGCHVLPIIAHAAENEPFATLDTIVITAGKIDRTAQETLDSVNITTEDQMQDSPALDDFTGILNKAPNVTVNGETDFSIRGISRGGVGGGSSDTFSVTVDGVTQHYMANQPGLISTWDLEQVEILRGPQSTTAGRNALAGAMVVKSKDPEFTNGGKLQLGYGTDNTYQVAIANTGAITDNLAYRISVEQKYTDGHTTNITKNKDDWNSQKGTNVRGKLLYYIDDDSDAMLTISHANHDRNGIRSSIYKDKRVNADNTPVFFDTDVTNVSVQYNNQLSDNWGLKSTSSYQNLTFVRESDRDSNIGNAVYNNDRSSNSWSQELLLNYDNADNIKAVYGLYAASGSFKNKLTILNNRYKILGNSFIANSINDSIDDYTNYAAFANIDYQLSPKVTLIGGLRFDYEEKFNNIKPNASLVEGTGNAVIDNIIKNVLTQAKENEGNNTQHVWLPKVGIDYAWSDFINTGFTYQRGYRPGGVSVNVVAQEAKEYTEEFTDNYEFSLRVHNDDNLSLASNIFYTDWQDQQVYVVQSVAPGDGYVTNSGKSHLYGIEIETAYQATPEIELTGGVGIVRTKFDDFVNNNSNYNGNEFIEARRLTANVGATYHSPTGWFAGGFVNHQGRAWSDLANSEKIDNYTLVDLKAGYDADNWGAYVYAKNALDKTYIADTLGYVPGTYDIADPRTVGITVNYEW